MVDGLWFGTNHVWISNVRVTLPCPSFSLQVWSILVWTLSMSLPLGPLALPALVMVTATGAKS